MKFSWLEPIASLFYLHMNFQSMLFERLWGISGDVIFLNRLHGILNQKYVEKGAKDFYHYDNFFHTVIEALVIALCMQETDYQTLAEFETKLGNKFNWPYLISKVESEYLGMYRVYRIQRKTERNTKVTVAAAFATKQQK